MTNAVLCYKFRGHMSLVERAKRFNYLGNLQDYCRS